MDPSEEAITEETQLDEVNVPGLPLEESERRAKWRAVPQRIRVADPGFIVSLVIALGRFF